ncbi:MAG: Fic family protein [Sphaerochaetaceae bacterium]|nr:Fic family protein [Sphaerochaetaceae bacterium]
MKKSQVQNSIDFVRFTVELEGGTPFTEEQEKLIEAVLEEDTDASEVINKYIEENGFDTNYQTGYDEMDTYPDSKCLVNYFNIKDKKTLIDVELFFVCARMAEMLANPLEMNFSFSYLQTIHERLFGDLYPSAGVVRDMPVSKSKFFCLPQFLDKQIEDIFKRLSEQKYLQDIDDREDFINELAFYMGEFEALHPFRDGNGRAIRFFFVCLVKKAGYFFNWDEADPDRMLEASIASVDGDYQPLIDFFEEIIKVEEE